MDLSRVSPIFLVLGHFKVVLRVTIFLICSTTTVALSIFTLFLCLNLRALLKWYVIKVLFLFLAETTVAGGHFGGAMVMSSSVTRAKSQACIYFKLCTSVWGTNFKHIEETNERPVPVLCENQSNRTDYEHTMTRHKIAAFWPLFLPMLCRIIL